MLVYIIIKTENAYVLLFNSLIETHCNMYNQLIYPFFSKEVNKTLPQLLNYFFFNL